MESFECKMTCLLDGTYFLDSLNKDEIQIKIRGLTLELEKSQDNIRVNSIFKASSELEADSKFKDAIEVLKGLIAFCTRRTPLAHSFNTYNLTISQGHGELESFCIVVNSMTLPDTNNILTNIDTITQSVHLENALHYYRLANLTDDNKESILNLYKCVESIIGFPGGNDKVFKKSLEQINLDTYLSEFKNLRTLRHKFDVGHSAGGKDDGTNSYKDVKISNKEVEDGKNLIQELISNTIGYLALGNPIKDIFIPDK